MTDANIRDFAYPCPQCAGRMAIKDSRPTRFRGRDSVRRRRRCVKCGHSVTTYETIATGNEQHAGARLAAAMLAIRCAHEAMGQLITAFDQATNPPSGETGPWSEAAE